MQVTVSEANYKNVRKIYSDLLNIHRVDSIKAVIVRDEGIYKTPNEPVIIKRGLPRVKPIPHAAHPEYELSIETTTGISAPPIGITTRKPKIIDTITIDQKIVGD